MTLGLDGCFNGNKTPEISDLAKQPLWLDVVEFVTENITDAMVGVQLNNQAKAIEARIAAELTEPGLGYLVKVHNIKIGGVQYFPSGQLFVPVGVGSEPLDALASSLVPPITSVDLPPGADDQSCYKWVYRDKDGLKKAKQEVANRRDFEQVAYREAQKRHLLGSVGTDPRTQLAKIEDSAAWGQVLGRIDAALLDQARKTRLDRYFGELKAAEAAFNKAYADFQLAAVKTARAARFQEVVGAIEGAATLVKAGIEAGVINSDASPDPNRTVTTEKVKIYVDAAAGYTSMVRERSVERYRDKQLIEGKLKREFKEMNLRPPSAQQPDLEWRHP